MSFLELIGLKQGNTDESSGQTETVRKIVERLEAMDSEKARYIAAFAYILGRVAHADLDISPVETRSMEEIVQKLGHLPEDQAVLVVQIAKSQHRLFGGTENFLVTREFAQLSNAVMMGEKSVALRDAPPTSAPSTFGSAKISSALLALTEPP